MASFILIEVSGVHGNVVESRHGPPAVVPAAPGVTYVHTRC